MNQGFGYGGYQNEMSFAPQMYGNYNVGGGSSSFAFILVLFILLVIIGCTCYDHGKRC